MNPYPPYQFSQPRDKIKSYFQPSTTHNPFSTSQVHSQSNSTISHHSSNSAHQNDNSTSAYQSDKYKTYYTQFQDYRPPQQQNNFYVTSNNIPLQRQKSYERNRFYTVTEPEKREFANNGHPLGNLHEDNFSHSMILMTNTQINHNNDQATVKKKDAYKFAASKFSSSRVESQYNSREKNKSHNSSHSQNKSQYLDKAAKKVSLKRDIAPISPKYQAEGSNVNTTLKYPPHNQPSFVNISNRFNINQNSNTLNSTPNRPSNTLNSAQGRPQQQQQNTLVPHHQKSMPFLPSGNDSSSVYAQNYSDIHQKSNLDTSQKLVNQDTIMPSTLQRFSQLSQNSSDISINRRNSDKQVSKQLSFKKTSNKERVSTYEAQRLSAYEAQRVSTYEAQRAISSYDPQRTTPSSQSSSTVVNQFMSQVSSNNNDDDRSVDQKAGITTGNKPFFGSIRSNSSKQKAQQSTQHLIDSQVLTDMKISRIQQSTNNLEQKLLTVTKSLQQLIHQSRQQQVSINQINTYITKQQQQGLTPHDIKRIKKQLKIMKTNFQTAFTSMTDQINRKLIKEESIMRSLSDQITVVAEDNLKLTQTIERRSRKVDSLQKSMTSFMRENEERMENLVLNESFSSSKRSKNHSFEYGLDLKNMSSDDNYSSGKSYYAAQNNSNMTKKLQSIEKEISKMKVFHIKQQQTYQGKFVELKKDIDKVMNDQQKHVLRTDAQHMIRQAVDQILQVKLDNWHMVQTQHQRQKQQRLNEELHSIKHKIDELNKICHQQLYDYRMNKLQQTSTINPKFVTQSKIKTMNSQLQNQLSQLQTKQRSMLITLSDFQQRLISYEDRQHTLVKNFDDLKLKELKHTGDVREVQLTVKEINHILHSLSSFKQTASINLNDLSQITGLQKGLLNSLQARTSNLQTRITEADRINAIQTENIESINNEFQRVINKEIIPKIQQVHHAHIDISHKIHSLTTDIKRCSEAQGGLGNNYGENSLISMTGRKSQLLDETVMEKKLQQYLTENMSKFITSKVKLISTKLLSSKSPLSKIGLFKDKRPPSAVNHNYDTEPQISKQETYLIDEDGYLMDWQGAYLMEVDEYGSRKKIRVSQEELYFMQVNGLEIKRTQGV